MLKKASTRASQIGLSLFLVVIIVLGSIVGFSLNKRDTVVAANAGSTSSASTPKYIFLFIGDGMSYAQIQAASYYLGAVQSKGGVKSVDLSFMNFPSVGSARTFDSTSFAPDSASTATSISTGYKTYSGTINMDTTFTISYETISEKLKKQLGYKIGIISSVNINHATPAAFYAHQASRGNYYEIGLELVKSGFDYFAGGAFLAPNGSKGDLTSITDLAKKAGYKVVTTYKAQKALKASDGKAILIAENVDSAGAMNYSLDAKKGELSLADYVTKGIEMLNNEKGFFMMVEGGKIDWAGHANDAGANINDTLAFSDAVAAAIKFYNEHPNDTLILVTGDHETGGMSIGFAGTNYDTFLTNYANQTITYEEFGTKYVADYKKNNTSFSAVMKDVKNLFGLVPANDYEIEQLEKAYKRTMTVGASSQSLMTTEDYILYGTYDPLTVTISHILNNQSGIGFTSYSHTGVPVPVFAIGSGAGLFEGYYDNTDIYKNLAKITGVK